MLHILRYQTNFRIYIFSSSKSREGGGNINFMYGTRTGSRVLELGSSLRQPPEVQSIRGHFPMDAISVLERLSLPKRYQSTGSPCASFTHQHPLANSTLYLQQIKYGFFVPWCHERIQKVPLKQHFLSGCCSTESKGDARSATSPFQQRQQQQQQKLEQNMETQLLAGCQPSTLFPLQLDRVYLHVCAFPADCQNRCFPVIRLRICSQKG